MKQSKAEKHRKDIERRQRARAEVRSILVSRTTAERKRREALQEREASKRRKLAWAVKRLSEARL